MRLNEYYIENGMEVQLKRYIICVFFHCGMMSLWISESFLVVS